MWIQAILYYQILWCFSDWYTFFTHNSVHICLGPDYVMVMVDDHWSTQNMKILHDVLLYVSQCRDVCIISCKYKCTYKIFCIFSCWKKSLMNVQRKRRIFYQLIYNEWNYNEWRMVLSSFQKDKSMIKCSCTIFQVYWSCMILSLSHN